MSLSGELGDIGLFEVIQQLHQLRKTGELHVKSEVEEGRIGFCRGLVVSVGVPGARYLGDILLARGLATDEMLGAALRVQFEGGGARSLGQILISDFAIGQEALAAAVIEQIHENAQRLLSCRTGSFEFVPCPINPIDDVALAPFVSIDPQHLMLEVARRAEGLNGGAHPAMRDRSVTPVTPVAERVIPPVTVSGVQLRPRRPTASDTAYLYLRRSKGKIETPFK